jgi:ankyrin repeat protein
MIKIMRVLLVFIFLISFGIKPFALLCAETDYSRTDAFLKIVEEFNDNKKRFHHHLKNDIENYLKNYSSELRALVYAIACGDFQTADLLKNEVDIFTTDSEGKNLLLLYAAVPHSKDFAEQINWLISNGIEIDVLVSVWNTTEKRSDGSLIQYTRYDTYLESVVTDELALGTILFLRPDLSDKQNPLTGITPLGHASCQEIAYGPIDLLLSYGVEIDAQDKKGNTPLILATIYGQYRNAILLLSYGANPDICFKHNNRDYKNILDYLISSPISVEDIQFENSKKNNKKIDNRTRIRMSSKKALIKLLQAKLIENSVETKVQIKTILRLLQNRFGTIEEALEIKINKITNTDTLNFLMDNLLKCESIDEFMTIFDSTSKK